MKKLVQAVFLVVCAMALGVAIYYWIATSAGKADASRSVATRRVVVGETAGAAEDSEARTAREAATNRIDALPNEVVLNVDTVNLDQDEGDEQILTVRKTDRGDGRLWVVVADFIPSRRGWTRAWEGESLATKATTFSIRVSDLSGDHSLDIACSGINDQGEQTLCVFRPVPTDEQELLSYQSALSVTGDAVVIDEVERSDSYQLGQTSGEGFAIQVWRRDSQSENLLDQVRTTWSWDARKAVWLEAGSERIPGATVEKEMAARLLTGVPADFERFLRGVWYEAGAGPRDPKARLLVFDRSASTITFYSTEAQEVFRWTESQATRYGIYVGSQNESVPDLRRLMNIELTGADTISLRVFEDLKMKVDAEDRWDGSYRKLPEGAEGSAAAPARGSAEQKLEGIYRGSDGMELSFLGRNYILAGEGREEERGGFTLYRVGSSTVLELVALKGNGLVSARRAYRLSYQETRKGRELIRRIVLSPARVAITGIEILEESELSLEQSQSN